jgi:FtsH-binding integral membrane protein
VPCRTAQLAAEAYYPRTADAQDELGTVDYRRFFSFIWGIDLLHNGGQLIALAAGGTATVFYVSATLTFYMSIYNLFTSLLQLLMALAGKRD